jgi:hypothetical protein
MSVFFRKYRMFNFNPMDGKCDVKNNFFSLQKIETDSSMFFCQPKQEEEEDENISIQHDETSSIINKKREKKTVSFPFGKW